MPHYDILDKNPSESRTYGMDFSELMATGETISSITSITSVCDDITIGAGSISGQTVSFNISGGTANTRCTIVVTIVTSLQTLVGAGILRIAGEC